MLSVHGGNRVGPQRSHAVLVGNVCLFVFGAQLGGTDKLFPPLLACEEAVR